MSTVIDEFHVKEYSVLKLDSLSQAPYRKYRIAGKEYDMIKDLTTGRPGSVLWRFSLPMFIGVIFQQVYNTADSIVVGRFVGKEALAAVGGSVNQIVMLIVEVFVGLTSGASVIMAQFYGARDRQNLHKTLHTAYAFAIVTGAVVGIMGFMISPNVLVMMKTPSELMPDSITYLHIYFCGMIFNIIYIIISVFTTLIRAILPWNLI